MKSYDIIVIGGGSGGLVVAVGAAQLGARVAIVEKKALGGDCLYTGCVPSKTLIRSARFAADARRAVDFGFTLSETHFVNESFAAIADRVQRVIETVGKHDDPERFRAMGVDVIFGVPRFLSPSELEIESTQHSNGTKQIIKARRFCISTGSRPAVPSIGGLEETGFVTNEEIFQLNSLPQSLLVLGGGPVGLELGQSFARFGSRVTIVEMGDRLLPKEDEEISAGIERHLRTEGLEILLKTEAISAEVVEGHKKVTVKQNGEVRDLTLAAIENSIRTAMLPRTNFNSSTGTTTAAAQSGAVTGTIFNGVPWSWMAIKVVEMATNAVFIVFIFLVV